MDKENKFHVLYEYVTQSQTENKGKMQGETQKGPTRMTLQDIVGSHKTDKQHPNDIPEPNTPLPLPLTNNHLSILADIYAKSAELQSTIKKVYENPNIKNNKHKESIKSMFKKMGSIKEIIKSLEEDLNQLGIDT